MIQPPARVSCRLCLILRIDRATSSGPWFMVLMVVLMGLGFTDSPLGYAAAVALFVTWVGLGTIGKRHEARGEGHHHAGHER
ncbi:MULTISPECIES: hypothetical protein [Streptomyces]|uniref:Uncharacterized protein n=2 Tax=Streptomyces TaxID=1883 RepID=A0A100YAC1_9ACTN|nr:MULTISPECIES: hypothetical protein [Streptomyces]KUH40680.1 hypothetical protein ATE80_00365 [Streptomyces kanasensis]UUS29474.1 hypothetical protein NRO40_00570 [Streptomyces changanensis]